VKPFRPYPSSTHPDASFRALPKAQLAFREYSFLVLLLSVFIFSGFFAMLANGLIGVLSCVMIVTVRRELFD